MELVKGFPLSDLLTQKRKGIEIENLPTFLLDYLKKWAMKSIESIAQR